MRPEAVINPAAARDSQLLLKGHEIIRIGHCPGGASACKMQT